MMRKSGKIAIVENLGGELGEYCYRQVARYMEQDFECFKMFAKDGFPEDVKAWAEDNNIKGVVIDGSEKSPFNTDRWIRREGEFIEKYLKLHKPLLGICFGHEILAHAAGGRLKKGRKLRVELDEVTILKKDALFDGLGKITMQPVSHSVQVSVLPPRFVHLAESFDCEFMAMRHKDFPCYGVQFHPEADKRIKDHDKVWRVMTDEDFRRSDGPAVIRNYSAICAAFA